MVTEYERKKAEKMTGEVCGVCGTELYSDPGVHELGIYLHARRYACLEGRWSYETGLPGWALPPDGVEGPRETVEKGDLLGAEVEKLQIDREKDTREVNGAAPSASS